MFGARRQEDDVVFTTHEQYYELASEETDVVLVENVPEYPHGTVLEHLGPEWSSDFVKLDPRLFGMPCSRPRAAGPNDTFAVRLSRSRHVACCVRSI